MALHSYPTEIDHLRLKARAGFANNPPFTELDEELFLESMPVNPAPFGEITPKSAQPFRMLPQAEPQSRLQQAQTGFSIQPNDQVVFQPNRAFLKGENPQVPIRTGPNTAYLPGGSIESGDRKLFITPDGTMTNFPTDRDISRFAVRVKQPTTPDLIASLNRNIAQPAPSPTPKTAADWAQYKSEVTSTGLDLTKERRGESGQIIRLKPGESAAMMGGLAATYDAPTSLGILEGESSLPTRTLLEGPAGKIIANKLIRLQQEFDAKIAPKLAGVKSIEEINKLVKSMDGYDPKLANQFKAMAERGLAQTNPGRYAELARTQALSSANEAGMASWFRASHPDDPRGELTDKELASTIRKNEKLVQGWIAATGGRQAMIDLVTGKTVAFYPSAKETESPLSQASRDRVINKNTGETRGMREAVLNVEMAAYGKSDKPDDRVKFGKAKAELHELFKQADDEERQLDAAVRVSTAGSLSEQAAGIDPDKAARAAKAFNEVAPKEDQPYLFNDKIQKQTFDESWADVIPNDMVRQGAEGVIIRTMSTEVLAKEVATEARDRLSNEYSETVMRDSIKTVLARHGKKAGELSGSKAAQEYVQGLTEASQTEFDKRAKGAFARVNARKTERMQVVMDAYVENGVMKTEGDVGGRYKAVQAKASDQQFVRDSEIGRKNGALDTAEDYLMADISLNWPELKDVARAYLSGNPNVVGASKVAGLLAANLVKFNTQLLSDTVEKMEKSPEAAETKRQSIGKFAEKNRRQLVVFSDDPTSTEIVGTFLDDDRGIELKKKYQEAASSAEKSQILLNEKKRVSELGMMENKAERTINILKAGLIPTWTLEGFKVTGIAGADEVQTRWKAENLRPTTSSDWNTAVERVVNDFADYPDLFNKIMPKVVEARNKWEDEKIAGSVGYSLEKLPAEQQDLISEIRKIQVGKDEYFKRNPEIETRLWREFYSALPEGKKNKFGEEVLQAMPLQIEPDLGLAEAVREVEGLSGLTPAQMRNPKLPPGDYLTNENPPRKFRKK